jgi:Tfp pilus assembly protein PilO
VRKSVLIAGAAVLMMSFYVLVITPVSEKRASLRERRDADFQTLLRYRSFVSGAKVSREELLAARKELEGIEQGVIRESQEPLAFAELQLRLQDAAGSAGLSTLTIRPLPAKSEKQKGYATLPIYMEAEGGIKALSDFLKSLDSADSYVRIDTLIINHKDVREQRELRVKMQVSGLMKP